MNEPLADALEQVASRFVTDSRLLSHLPADAVLARADGGELHAALPRMLELLVETGWGDGRGSPADPVSGPGEVAPWQIIDRLVAGDWQSWPTADRQAVEAVFDAWWATTLAVYPFPPGADTILGSLARLGLPLVRWLHPWLEALDGAGGEHLADVIEGQLLSPAWAPIPDARNQVLAWCRTEPVIMGITVVAGPNLGSDRVGALLDRLL